MMMAHFYVLLGLPGAGKGTQAELLSRSLNLPHISTGELFRRHLSNETHLGVLAKGYMDRGELVPDDVTIEMVRERLAEPDAVRGGLLDGFPRNVNQAEALNEILAKMGDEVTRVIYIDVPVDALIDRLTGRLVCKAQGHIYHMSNNPPQQPGVCDIDGSELFQRQDDSLETVQHRIRVYQTETEPLVAYYRESGSLLRVDGHQTPKVVASSILKALSKEVVR
jgi:adenylate kinase